MQTLNPKLKFSCAGLFKTDFHRSLANSSDSEDLFGKSWNQGLIKEVQEKAVLQGYKRSSCPRPLD